MFFGALLSAIKSCASATLLAPSVSFSENIMKPFLPRISDRNFLRLNRIVLFAFTCLVTVFAMNSESDIYHMVENAYKVTLVGAFVPLTLGLYWKRATPLGGILSVVLGLIVWVGCEKFYAEAAIPPQLAGLVASLLGMVLGSLAFRGFERPATHTT
jgi:Na+/proline symporter